MSTHGCLFYTLSYNSVFINFVASMVLALLLRVPLGVLSVAPGSFDLPPSFFKAPP